MPFSDLPIEVDREELREMVFSRLAAAFPGWAPSPGNLETFLADAFVGLAADLGEEAIDVSREIFRVFGSDLAQLPAVAATPAHATTTWTMIDDAGYTIPAGTLVGISATGSDLVAFRVATEVLVPPGSTATATGEVAIEAVIDGAAANGLSETPQLIDALRYVSSIALEGATAGGADAESVDDYLSRLVEELQLQTPTPVLASDAAILARRVPGVWRATALDGYDPSDSSDDNERMVTIAAQDADGAAVSSTVKDAIAALLDELREVNFVFHTVDPTITDVDVKVSLVAHESFDAATVEAAVEAALSDHLSPLSWGISPTGEDPRSWLPQTTVRQSRLVAIVNNVPGVSYVTALTLRTGDDAYAADDVELDGPAALANAGSIEATVS